MPVGDRNQEAAGRASPHPYPLSDEYQAEAGPSRPRAALLRPLQPADPLAGTGTDADDEADDVGESQRHRRRPTFGRRTSGSDPLMDDALRSLPPVAERQARRRETTKGSELVLVSSRESFTQSTSTRRMASRGSPERASRATSEIKEAEVKSPLNPFTWLAGMKGKQTSDRPETSSDTGFKSMEKVSLRGRQRQTSILRSRKSEEREQRERQKEGNQVVILQRPHEEREKDLEEGGLEFPPLDGPVVPPAPNETTASALAQVASRKGLSRRARRLQFAPQQTRVRKKDLPGNFQEGDLYRGLDEYISASRARRRAEREGQQKSKGGRSSRGSRSSRASRSSRGSRSSAGSSSDSDSSSSGSSSSSSSSGRGLTLSRIRAFFGDSSSSSSSSSESDSSSDAQTHQSSVDGQSVFSRAVFGRGRRASHAASENRSPSPEAYRVDYPADSPRMPKTPRGVGPNATPQTPRTPRVAFGNVQWIGGADRARRRRKAKRAKRHQQELEKKGLLPTRPSRKAQKRALELREKAGGVTEYTLLTPISLPVARTQAPAGDARALMDEQRANLPPPATYGAVVDLDPPDRVLHSLHWTEVKERLREFRHQLRQKEGAAGDLGVLGGDRAMSHLPPSSRQKRRKERSRSRPLRPTEQSQSEYEAKSGRRARFVDPMEAVPGHDDDEEEEDADFYGGDLALPPPALDLPEPALAIIDDESDEDDSGSKHSSHRRRSSRSSARRGSADITFERERLTGWHMSDVPLTPKPFTGMSQPGQGTPVPSDQSGSGGTPASAPASSGLPSDLRPGLGPESIGMNVRESEGPMSKSILASDNSGKPGPAWWLDISCPTYRDMVEISKLFPLHPLTVEDILQQDPREKIEVFSSLGYYFCAIRAIDEKYFKYSTLGKPSSGANAGKENGDGSSTASPSATLSASPQPKRASSRSPSNGEEVDSIEMKELKTDSQQGSPGRHGAVHVEGPADLLSSTKGSADDKEGLEGLSVGACNLYLVVFSHGVISFHTEDVGQHIRRVRRRMLDPAQPVQFSSDWIFHGLLDSIVDAFFPLADFVEAEVEDIEVKTSPETASGEAPAASIATLLKEVQERQAQIDSGDALLPSTFAVNGVGKAAAEGAKKSSWLPNRLLCSRRTKLGGDAQQGTAAAESSLPRKKNAHDVLMGVSAAEQTAMLRRITTNRKIVNGLSRLLLPKSDTIRGLRKRLAELRHQTGSSSEVSVHMGDIGDHIVSLLGLLHSGESRLAGSYQTYLVNVRINSRRSRNKTDKTLTLLLTISVTAIACGAWPAMWGVNATVPQNVHGSSVHHWFFGILGGVGAILIAVPSYAAFVRRDVDRRYMEKKMGR